MTQNSSFWLCASLLLPLAGAWADALPLDALKESPTATTELGAWSLRGWSDHHKFPALKESADAEKGAEKGGAARWNMTGGNAYVSVKGDVFGFGMGGTVFKNGWDAKYNWIPALQFKPNAPGAFKLSGAMELWGRGFPNQKVVAWAVFRAIDSDVTVVDEARYEVPETLDLSTRARLKAVKVAEGESLVLAVWHPSFNYSAGANLRNFAIDKASPADISAMEAALKAEKEAAAKAYADAVQTGRENTLLPLVPLAATGSAQSKNGRFSIVGVSNREKFPDVEGVVEVEGKDTFNIPDGKDVRVAVKKDTLAFFTRGRNSNDKGFIWAPAIRFQPAARGNYALGGTLALSGKASSKPENPDAVAFAVWKWKNGVATPVALQKYADKTSVNLAEFTASDGSKPLQKITLGEGEELLLSVWRPTWHYEAGANLTGFEVKKVD